MRRRLCVAWLILIAGILGTPGLDASAQTPVTPVTITANTPFQVEATHDGSNTTSYSLRIDGAEKQVKPVTALSNGVVRMDAPGLTPGTHTVTVAAVNDFGAKESVPLGVATGTPPSTAPGGLRIITVVVTVQGGHE